MAQLTTEHKKRVVKELASFSTPGKVQQLLKEQYNIEASSSQISFYNPENNSSVRLAKKWRHLFYDTRRRYIEEVSTIPIANKGYRLNEMQHNYEKAKKTGNIVLAQQILEQAAKEVGGVFEQGSLIPPSGSSGNFFQQINQTIINQQNNKHG